MKKIICSIILGLILVITIIPILSSDIDEVSARQNDEWEYTLYNDGSITLNSYIGSSQDVIIPSTINGGQVTRIGSEIFKNINVYSVTISNGITKINTGAFKNCRTLKHVQIPASVTNIGENVFEGCIILNSIVVSENNRYYSDGYGGNCIINKSTDELIYGSGSTVIPGNVKSIAKNAFNENYLLERITIPEGVTIIKYGAFYNCENLESVKLPTSLSTIEGSAFGNCGKLESLSLPYGLSDAWSSSFCDVTLLYVNQNSFAAQLAIKYGLRYAYKSVNTAKLLYAPQKLNYVKGQPLDLTGGCVYIKYTDGTEEIADLNSNMIQYDKTAIGSVKVTVKCDKFNDYYTIQVSEGIIDSVSFSKPRQTMYYVDDTINLSEGKITITYKTDDRYTITIDMKPEMVVEFDTSTAGDRQAIIEYKGYRYSYNIYVYNLVLESIEISNLPKKLDYIVGESFDSTGLVVTGFYERGKKKVVNGYEILGFGDSLEKNTITVKYEDKTATFDVFIHESDGKWEITEATCTEDGYKVLRCTRCNKILRTEIIDNKLGHLWDDGIVTEEPTYYNDGTKRYTCKRCGATREIYIPMKSEIKKGEIFVVSGGIYKYIGNYSVVYVKPSNKKCKTANVKNFITIGLADCDVIRVEDNAFKGCKNLTKVTIGNSVKQIGKKAFYGCKKLNTITIKSKRIKKIGGNAFKGINVKAKIKVPKKKLEQYKKLIKKAKAPKKVNIIGFWL